MFAPLAILTFHQHKLDAPEVYRRAKGAVVTVRTPESSGTGFALGDRRTVVTAYHVVRSSPESIHVDQTGSSAVRLIGYDAAADVALLELSRPVTGALALRRSGTPQPGTKVFAIGTPLGYLESTISEGIVSGVRRMGDVALLQITAPVSHGSSGGPVLDEEGRVVGLVDSAIEAGQSLNFAMSAYTVGRALARIKASALPSPSADIGLRNNPYKDIIDRKDPFQTALRKHRIEVLLTGPAALYWMYRQDMKTTNLTFEQRGRTSYYLSKNGKIYYRDASALAHWVTPPTQGLSVSAKEASACRGLQGYNGTRTGETNLMRFAARHAGN